MSVSEIPSVTECLLESNASGSAGPSVKIPKAPPNTTETDLAVGAERMRRLIPYACKWAGRPLPADQPGRHELELELRSVRSDLKVLVAELGIGEKMIYRLVEHICVVGVENLQAMDFLKKASNGGKGKCRLPTEVEDALYTSAHKVCVINGRRPGKQTTRDEIAAEMRALGVTRRLPGRKTIDTITRSPAITTARTAKVMGDHMTRVAGEFATVPGISQCVQVDGTLFTSADEPRHIIYVLNDVGEILGIGNAVFGLDCTTRGLWTALGVVGALNTYLTGYAIRRGLLSKQKLLDEYGIRGSWLWHGKPGKIVSDLGREFVGAHIKQVFKERAIGFYEQCPKESPHLRGREERFNRTAHKLFAQFVESARGRDYLRPVKGKPNAIGIRFRDYDRALIEWVVTDYQCRKSKALGGASPIDRFCDLAEGRRDLRPCGVPQPVADTPLLMWDFLWERPRVINQLGIFLENRRYCDPRLATYFVPGTRSSRTRQSVRINPYGMGYAYVKATGPKGLEILAVPWVPEPDRLLMDDAQMAKALNPSLWEWRDLYRTIRAANVTPTESSALELAMKRESEAGHGRQSGAPSRRTKQTERANREMRKRFEKIDLEAMPPPPAELPEPSPRQHGGNGIKPRCEEVILLPTGGGGADEY